MSEIAQPAGRLSAQPADGLFQGVSLRIPLTWEAAAYAALFVFAFGLRFWDLGARAMHHDESLHAFYALQLLQGNGYEHSPLLHGPFQFFGMAFTFFLTGGASDGTARVMPALFGGAMVVLPLALRGRLGRGGALATAALLALSPALVYYSRFAREDIYFAFFTLALVVCLWRYLDEQKPQYLYASAGLLALSFATKETAFIFAAIVLLFLDLWVASVLARRPVRGERSQYEVGWRFLAFAPFAWVIVAASPFVRGLRERLRDCEPAANTLLVIGTLVAPQLAAAIELPLEAAGVEVVTASEERLFGVPAVLGLIVASAAVGLAWNPRVWLKVATCFYIPYVLLFSAFFTDIGGLGSGLWESLDYWLGEQDVSRGNQPDFYYLMFWPAYEYVALLFAGPALLYFSLRGGPRSWLLTAIAAVAFLFFFGADSFEENTAITAAQIAVLPIGAVSLFLAVRGTMFERFLVFWTVSSLVAYSTVGERMPWLSVHIAVPLIVLAGYSIGGIVSWIGAPDRRTGVDHRGSRVVPRLVGAGVAIVALVIAGLSVRTAVMATYEHPDVPREFLFYTQTSPDVPDIVEQIDELAAASGVGRSLRIQVDSGHTWPWAWYLRDYNASFEPMGPDFQPEPGAIVIAGATEEPFGAPFADDYYPALQYTLRWWFPEDYREIANKDHLGEGIADFAATLTRAPTWERWWEFWFHRDILPRGGVEGRVFVPVELDAIELDPERAGAAGGSGPAADVEGRFIIGRLGVAPDEMQNPYGVALDGDGNVYVVDSDLGRVQKFDGRGNLLAAQGVPGGEGGQYNQPADIAVDASGNVYVADTWNHRIQKLAPDLTPIGTWGRPTSDLVNPPPDQLWAPRGIAIDRDGTILVVDSGTNRIRRYSSDGAHIGDFGQRGKDPGDFDEPTGIAIAPDGSIYVADSRNARIQKFAPGFSLVTAIWPIEDWADLNPRTKPQLEVLPDGRLIASDPAHGRLLLLNQEGRVTVRLESALEIPLYSPNGVAFDTEGRFVYVTDGLAGHIRRFPFTDFALR
jgi:uncharacterized protein (TIGR03663 family)